MYPVLKAPSYSCLPRLGSRSAVPARNLGTEMWLCLLEALWKPTLGVPVQVEIRNCWNLCGLG